MNTKGSHSRFFKTWKKKGERGQEKESGRERERNGKKRFTPSLSKVTQQGEGKEAFYAVRHSDDTGYQRMTISGKVRRLNGTHIYTKKKSDVEASSCSVVNLTYSLKRCLKEYLSL